MANNGLREVCADILLGLMPIRQGVGDARGAGYLLRGARTLQHAERWEYGDPVPADEHSEAVAALEQALSDARAERDEALTGSKAESKAYKRFKKAMVAFDDNRDDVRALLDAWDEYRAARS